MRAKARLSPSQMARKLLDDCFAHDKKRLRHDEALAILKERVGPVAAPERVPPGGGGRAHPGGGRGRAAAGAGAHQCRRRRLLVRGGRLRRRGRERAAVEGRAAAGHPLAQRAGARASPRASSRARSCRRGTTPSSCRRTCASARSDGRDGRGHPGRAEARRQRAQGRRGREGGRDCAGGRRGAAAAGPGGAGLARHGRGATASRG